MSEKKLISAIEDLQGSIYNLKDSVDKLHAIQKDIFNSDPHDMMQTLNGSLQELIKTLEMRPLK